MSFMCYFRYIDKGEGPTKLFIGGVHGKEGETSGKFLKLLNKDDFSKGQIFIYNLNESPYISTLKNEFYKSKQGKLIISLIKKHKPDFYTELHCYNIKNYKNLIDDSRRDFQGVPPLIDCGDYVLISSVSPLIRRKYFTKETICKTLEMPCFTNKNSNKYLLDRYNYNKKLTIERYFDIFKLISKSYGRKEFEYIITKYYPKQVDLARIYVKEIFGKYFPPF